ncbi:hypothetical protein C1Y22_35635, partial [Pseudomonas sp. MPR-R2A5]|uniref:hypothetical protein n=1 Tax=Pseudomonas sp. MPR-R2A5 TaxID=2070622 RepID=UPI000CBF68A8
MGVFTKAGRIEMCKRLLMLGVCGLCHLPANAQTGGGTPAAPQVRMVRVTVGAKAETRSAAFLMTDQRTTFY